MVSKLIDAHFHLDFYKNHKDIYDEINRLQQYTICMTNSPGVFLSCKKMYAETKYLKFALGLHPQETGNIYANLGDFEKYFDMTNYIGEIGLDFGKKNLLTKDVQIKNLKRILNMAHGTNKVISLHIRNAEKETLEILTKYDCSKTIIHWYGGQSNELQEFVNLGCYFSINTNMVNNSSMLGKLFVIPQNRILIESDGPFTKVQGRVYKPNLLKQAYQSVGKALEIEELDKEVYRNFRNLLVEGV